MAIRFPESRGAGSVGPHAVKSCGLALEEVSVDGHRNVDDGGEPRIVHGVDDGGPGDGATYHVDGLTVRGVLIGPGLIRDMPVQCIRPAMAS